MACCCWKGAVHRSVKDGLAGCLLFVLVFVLVDDVVVIKCGQV
jgi:hypothetical protein